jgi:hypothetical protein
MPAFRRRNTTCARELRHGATPTPARWRAVEPTQRTTRLRFGSWIGNLDQSGWRFIQRPHRWYSRVLLGWV